MGGINVPLCPLNCLAPSVTSDKFFGPPALWHPQNVFGPPTVVAKVVNFRDWAITLQKNCQRQHDLNVSKDVRSPW